MVRRSSVLKVDVHVFEVNALFNGVKVRMQRVADHRRLLVNLLLHVVVIVALADQRAGQLAFDNGAVYALVVRVVNRRAFAGQHAPIAVFDIAERVGERSERYGIRAKIHFAFTIADGEG